MDRPLELRRAPALGELAHVRAEIDGQRHDHRGCEHRHQERERQRGVPDSLVHAKL